MKKIFLAYLVIGVTSPAFADWTLIPGPESKLQMYVDLDTVRVNGVFRKAWTISDMDIIIFSMKAVQEFDCYEQKSRILQASATLGKKGEGRKLPEFEISEPTRWDYIEPRTTRWNLMDAICKHKPRTN